VEYVSAEGVVVFTYQIRGVVGQAPPRLVLHGLQADRTYRRQSDNLQRTGAALMTRGLPLTFSSGSGLDYRSDLQVWVS
jgi:hypothetical protein